MRGSPDGQPAGPGAEAFFTCAPEIATVTVTVNARAKDRVEALSLLARRRTEVAELLAQAGTSIERTEDGSVHVRAREYAEAFQGVEPVEIADLGLLSDSTPGRYQAVGASRSAARLSAIDEPAFDFAPVAQDVESAVEARFTIEAPDLPASRHPSVRRRRADGDGSRASGGSQCASLAGILVERRPNTAEQQLRLDVPVDLRPRPVNGRGHTGSGHRPATHGRLAAAPQAPPTSPPPPSPYGPPSPQTSPPSPYGPPATQAGPPYGPPPTGWQSPPARKAVPLTAILIGALVVVLVAVSGFVVVRRLNPATSLPDHVGQLSALQSPGAKTEANVLVAQMNAAGFKHTTAKVYTADGLTQAASAITADIPANLRDQPNIVTGFANGFTLGTTASPPAPADPGPNGGSMACGLRPGSLVNLSFCVWSDDKTISEVNDTRGTVTEAHAMALQIRAANGH